MSGYNGWKNRATWNVMLWIGNDEGMYTYASEVGSTLEQFTEGDASSICAELFPDGVTPDRDKVSDADMKEIAEHLTEDFC